MLIIVSGSPEITLPTVNKLFGGSGLTKKIGEKIDGGYSSFAKYYQNEWILNNLNSEFNVISSNLESTTRKNNES